MIIVTGAAGFIGSVLVSKLNKMNINDLILVDDFKKKEKILNLENKKYFQLIDRELFINWLPQNGANVDFIFHIGARTDTTEFNVEIFNKLNLNYSKSLWKICAEKQIPLIYASSAATYGMGELGYDDNHQIISQLKPLNPYGESKNDFDKWVLQQTATPPFWAGFKFFNVYGPNEYHKGRMASVIYHAFNQIKATDSMKLFRSHNPQYKDGEQIRDFVYVKDVVDVLAFFFENRNHSAIYNLGTGKARTFIDLVKNTFAAMQKPKSIHFVDTPLDIRDKYQYFTEANISKLLSVGYNKPFHTLEEGVFDYVTNYLQSTRYE